jgi:hypothetical protein
VKCLPLVLDVIGVRHDYAETVLVEMVVKLLETEGRHSLFGRDLIEIVIAGSMVRGDLEVVVMVDVILRTFSLVDEIAHVNDEIALRVDSAAENPVEPIERRMGEDFGEVVDIRECAEAEFALGGFFLAGGNRGGRGEGRRKASAEERLS